MTVSTATSRIEYTGDAVTTAFSFPYYFLANGDLKVYLDGVLQTITTHYTVAGAGVGAGGTVTFVTAPPNGDLVVIYREVAITQSVDYTPNDPFPANTHEQALDRLTMIAQQIDEEAGRALALPSTSTYSDLTVPDPQAGYYLQWKADLSGLQNVVGIDPALAELTSGDFTPTIYGASTAGTATGTFRGQYMRIGSYCFINISISLTSKGGMAGAIRVGNLPYTISNSPSIWPVFSFGMMYHFGIASAVYLHHAGRGALGGSYIDLIMYDVVSIGGNDAIQDTDIENDSFFTLSGFYKII